MRLPFFRAKDPAEPAGKPRRGKASKPTDEGPVQAARVQARRRLIGALVLLAAGIIGFPILFETQPRPLPVDTPILVADSGGVRVASAPAARPRPVLPADAGSEVVSAGAASAAAATASAVSPVTVAAVRPAPAASTPPATLASAPAAAPPKAVQAVATPAPVPAALPASARLEAVKPAPKPVAEAKPPAALPSPAPADNAPAAAGRFVVQVGAYNDAERLKAARQKVEKLGYKSYTQDVDTATGKRTRVRLGPFSTRQEAEAVAGKVKGAGMQANILAL